MAIVHVAVGGHAPIMWTRAHICIVSLALAQNAVVPLGALVVHVVSAIFLTFTAIKPLLSLPAPTINRVLVVSLLGHASDGGVVDEGGTDSTMITPRRSSNVAVAGTVVVTSLVTSPYELDEFSPV
jgi:hypothetical protein